VQFDPAALHASVDRLLALQPEALYLTHYSRVTGVPKLGRDLHARIDGTVAVALRLRDSGPGRTARMEEAFFAFLCSELDGHGDTQSRARRLELLGGDVKLNVQGLEVWLDKK
jgi:hypothetical protein